MGISVVCFSQNKTEVYTQEKLLTDTLFQQPFIDIDEMREKPVKHHYVHGGFKGTDTRFSYYFPLKENYKGHFFQYITPVPINENLSQSNKGEEDKIGFSVTHGAYFIETNGGGKYGSGMPGSGIDAKIGAFRANAAAAQYSKLIANKLYGNHRVYGYAFGGSGGAYRTIGGIENTEGVWDGAVPYVLGSPMAIPNVFTVRIHSMQQLQNVFPTIVDAFEPGGIGSAALDNVLSEEEKNAFNEATNMGFPQKAWFAYKTMGLHAFPVLYPGIKMADAGYFKDFWNKPGYLGSDSNSAIRKARIQKSTFIKNIFSTDQAVKIGLISEQSAKQAKGTADDAWRSAGHVEGDVPVALQLGEFPITNNILGSDLFILSGAAKGKSIFISRVSGDTIIFGSSDLNVLGKLKTGDSVRFDNSDFLAAETYHRHQVPSKEYYAWDQFRNKDGQSIYPQRPMILGPLFTQSASGVLPTGKFKGKVILLGSLWDSEAFPWQQDWYRNKVKEHLGDKTDDNFRIWYTDHANHADDEEGRYPTHLVSYLGVLQQALLDLSDWVEKGIAPPSSTNYTIKNAQVIVPNTAMERKGIQPIIELKANGSYKTVVKKNTPVTFNAKIELPNNTGKIVSIQWDFEGKGQFTDVTPISSINQSKSTINIFNKHNFNQNGNYFVTLKVAAQRNGDEKTPFTKIYNLERVRVIVH